MRMILRFLVLAAVLALFTATVQYTATGEEFECDDVEAGDCETGTCPDDQGEMICTEVGYYPCNCWFV